MPTENYTTKFKVDISDLKNNIKAANAQIKTYAAEIKNASAGMKKGEETADSLTQKINAQQKIVKKEKWECEAPLEPLADGSKCECPTWNCYEGDADNLSKALKLPINMSYGLTSANFDNPMRDIRNKNNIGKPIYRSFISIYFPKDFLILLIVIYIFINLYP